MAHEWELLWLERSRQHWELTWNPKTSRDEPKRQVNRSRRPDIRDKVELRNRVWFLVDDLILGTKEIVSYLEACSHFLNKWRTTHTPKRKFEDDYRLQYTGLLRRDILGLLPYAIALSPDRHPNGRSGALLAIPFAIQDFGDDPELDSEQEVTVATWKNRASNALQWDPEQVQSDSNDGGLASPPDDNPIRLSAHQMVTQAIEAQGANKPLRRVYELLVEANEQAAARGQREAEWAKAVKEMFSKADEQNAAQAAEQARLMKDMFAQSNEDARQWQEGGRNSHLEARLAIRQVRRTVKEMKQAAEEVGKASTEIRWAVEELRKANEERKPFPEAARCVRDDANALDEDRSGNQSEFSEAFQELSIVIDDLGASLDKAGLAFQHGLGLLSRTKKENKHGEAHTEWHRLWITFWRRAYIFQAYKSRYCPYTTCKEFLEASISLDFDPHKDSTATDLADHLDDIREYWGQEFHIALGDLWPNDLANPSLPFTFLRRLRLIAMGVTIEAFAERVRPFVEERMEEARLNQSEKKCLVLSDLLLYIEEYCRRPTLRRRRLELIDDDVKNVGRDFEYRGDGRREREGLDTEAFADLPMQKRRRV